MSPDDVTEADATIFQDFIYAQIIEKCIARRLPIQVHTGMVVSAGFLDQGSPVPFEETVARYPQADFVLLHGGYPFTAQTRALVKKYPNVWVDGSWLSLLSLAAYRGALSQWLDALPGRNILGWGGDALRVEISYGSLTIATGIVADVPAEKVEGGCFSESAAFEIASQILRENARGLFKADAIRERRLKAAAGGATPAR